MQRLKLFILLFCIGVSLPLGYVIWRTYAGLAQEERAQMIYFSEALFDRMETQLAVLLEREENRAVEEYHPTLAENSAAQPSKRSPLAVAPLESYILGYFQNNPDGSFQTPLITDIDQATDDQRLTVRQLDEVNRLFNQRKFSIGTAPVQPVEKAPENEKQKKALSKEEKEGFAERFFTQAPPSVSPKTQLGRTKSRVEEITAQQAMNMASEKDQQQEWSATTADEQRADRGERQATGQASSTYGALSQSVPPQPAAPSMNEKYQVEVAPFQSVFIDPQRIFMFRRIALDNQIYRQGFVILIDPFLKHLAAAHFKNQPLAGFANLSLHVMERNGERVVLSTGIAIDAPTITSTRAFPAPFGFLGATLTARKVPVLPARRSLNLALWGLGAVLLVGLFAIYQSARTIVELSERRAQFVSSVTHELKTPLTNIRMYIEMLEQGIAATPEREQAYLGILGSESARLARLINNVLELSKLEKKQRHFHYQEGCLEDAISETVALMARQVEQEGFALQTNLVPIPPFAYDREVMIQVLTNLIENSIKFGKGYPERRITLGVDTYESWIRIAVSDTGPGIPKHALTRIFEDFYRVDNHLTRATGGTGIGLALVKKFMQAMGGRVQASNNAGPGCTITLLLPATTPKTA